MRYAITHKKRRKNFYGNANLDRFSLNLSEFKEFLRVIPWELVDSRGEFYAALAFAVSGASARASFNNV